MKDESLRSALAELVRLKNAGLLGVDHGGPEYGADCPICNAWIAARAALQQVPEQRQEPVAWIHPDWLAGKYRDSLSPVTAYEQRDWTPLYAEQRQDVLDARRPISDLLNGEPGLYAVGDTNHPDALVPVWKDAKGRAWSMTLDAILANDRWWPTAFVLGGPLYFPGSVALSVEQQDQPQTSGD